MKFYQKSFHSINSFGKPLRNSSNYSRNQSPYNSNYRGNSPIQRISQNRYNRSSSRITQYRNNYSRSNSNRPDDSFDTSSQSHSRKRHYSNYKYSNSSYIRHGNYYIKRIRSYSKNLNQRNNRSRDYSINKSKHQKSPTFIKTVHKITHKIGAQTTTKDKETTLNHLIETIHVIPILKTNVEAIRQKI